MKSRIYVPHSYPMFILVTSSIPVSIRVDNSVDPDQIALSEASGSGYTMFSKTDKSGFRRTSGKFCLVLEGYFQW